MGARALIDTREQLPLDLEMEFARIGLPTGDYSIEGFETRIVLERKSLGDLFGVVGNGRARFERELERLEKFDRAAIVIEAGMDDVLQGYKHSKIHPRAVIGSLLTWYVRHGVPPIFCGNRDNAAATIRKILIKYAEEKA